MGQAITALALARHGGLTVPAVVITAEASAGDISAESEGIIRPPYFPTSPGIPTEAKAGNQAPGLPRGQAEGPKGQPGIKSQRRNGAVGSGPGGPAIANALLFIVP